MESLKELGEPREFWEYIYQISKIPRCSEHEEHIRNYIIEEAKGMGYETELDKVGNLIIRLSHKASKSDNVKVVLQSHLDMVCEKNEETEHDFSKDPLKLNVIEINNEKWLTADGTTLGADNGVGIAYNLAIMKKLNEGTLDLGLIDLDLLFTVDEEQGLTGASKLDKNLINGKYLLNLDSEEENKFTIGCAGGRVFTLEIESEMIDTDLSNMISFRIDISGLQGGHSGTDINKQRANAIKILGEILWMLNSKFSIHLASIEGGNKPNAIPREVHSILYVKKSEVDDIDQYIQGLYENIKKLYEGSDSNLIMSTKYQEAPSNIHCFEKNFQNKILKLLFLMPNGPVSLHPTSQGLVHTSLNIGSIHQSDELIKVQISTRSLSDYDKDVLFEKIKTVLDLIQLNLNLVIDTVYPSWPPNFDSKLVNKVRQIYKKVFNEEAIIQAIHAGLECAYFSYYFPEMQMISLGPIIIGNHSPDEKLKIASAKKIWTFLIELIKYLD